MFHKSSLIPQVILIIASGGFIYVAAVGCLPGSRSVFIRAARSRLFVKQGVRLMQTLFSTVATLTADVLGGLIHNIPPKYT
jgi:hypothetical protein